MSNAVRLPESRRQRREPNAPGFTKYAKKPSFTSKMFLELLEHLHLLFAELETMKGSLIAISNMEIAEEPLYVIEVERDEGSPYSVLPNSP